MAYTIYDLRKAQAKYEIIYKRLLKSVDTPQHDLYLKMEIEADKECMKIKNNLGILAQFECPLTQTNKECMLCTGYYRKAVTGANKYMCSKDHPNKRKVHCAIYEYITRKGYLKEGAEYDYI